MNGVMAGTGVAAQLAERQHHDGQKGSAKSLASARASRNDVVKTMSLRGAG